MTPYGGRVRALLARVCRPRTLERLVDPAIADLHAECAAARSGPFLTRCRVLLVGYLALAKVVALLPLLACADALEHWTAEERSALLRAACTSVGAVTVVTLVLAQLSFPSSVIAEPQAGYPYLMLHLLPAMLPLSVPIGYIFGLVYGVPAGAWSRRLVGGALGVALLCSMAMFVNLAWVAPEANQRFREAVFGASLGRGGNELTLGEIRRRLREPATFVADDAMGRVRLEFAYHSRLAMPAATLALTVLILALRARVRLTRGTLAVAVVITLALGVGYDMLIMVGVFTMRAGSLPSIAAAWLPNVIVIGLAALLGGRRLISGIRRAPAAT